MALLKILYVSTFISLLSPASREYRITENECDKFKVKAEVYPDSKGAKIEIKTEDGSSPYKYIFYRETGHLISSDYDNNTVEGLKKGKYFCTVVDKKNCKKTIEIEIK